MVSPAVDDNVIYLRRRAGFGMDHSDNYNINDAGPTSSPCPSAPTTTTANTTTNPPEDDSNNNQKKNDLFLPLPFYPSRHVAYIEQLGIQLSLPTSYEGAVTEHLRMSGIYWSLTALHMLLPSAASVDALMGVTQPKNSHVPSNNSSNSSNNSSIQNRSIIDWVWTCYNDHEGSFGGNTGHPGHLLYTLSALQILAVSDQLHSINDNNSNNNNDRMSQHRDRMVQFVASLQQSDGSFVGDLSAREVDTRYTYCAFQCLILLLGTPLDVEGDTTAAPIDVPRACDYIVACSNLDGGFGSCIGAESHTGQVFCCVAALAMARRLDQWRQQPPPISTTNDEGAETTALPRDELLAWWLCERQCDSGGMNGRPEKQADVCYSWWNMAALCILGRVDWIAADALAQYILACQDADDGGIADRPEDMADVFHTFFGIGGLSLLGHLHSNSSSSAGSGSSSSGGHTYRTIDPIYALPTDVVRKMKLPGQVVASENGVDERLQGYDILPFRE